MPTDQVVELGRRTLQEVVILGGPILAIAMMISLIVNLVQVLTSIQEPTISTVPRQSSRNVKYSRAMSSTFELIS